MTFINFACAFVQGAAEGGKAGAAAGKAAGGKGGDKKGGDRAKSAGKGAKGGGKKTPDPPSAKNESKLKKRGEEDEEGKYIGLHRMTKYATGVAQNLKIQFYCN